MLMRAKNSYVDQKNTYQDISRVRERLLKPGVLLERATRKYAVTPHALIARITNNKRILF